jgi:hypothetical protein
VDGQAPEFVNRVLENEMDRSIESKVVIRFPAEIAFPRAAIA